MGAVQLTKRGRRAANGQMVDACEVRHPATFGELDPETGLRDEVAGALVYVGRCKVQTYEAHEQSPQSGQHVYSVQRYAVHLPAEVEVAVDQIITVTASVLDANLVDRRYRIAGFLHKSFATANRVVVDEVTH